ncbi:MAG: hypothetical protein Q7R39_09810 [Dehalococcoidia bacterium]|nr:hypothetical protein [Dehalococcoidia bacterium]
MPEYSVPGKPIPRIDERAPTAKGKVRFSVDVLFPGMLCGELLQGMPAPE